jgi:hypothetical protein
LKIFPKENIFVIANGNSKTPLDNTDFTLEMLFSRSGDSDSDSESGAGGSFSKRINRGQYWVVRTKFVITGGYAIIIGLAAL